MGKFKTSGISPIFRSGYPHVFKPHAFDKNSKELYSVIALFKTGDDLSAMKAAAKEACIEEWGPDMKKWPSPIKLPFRDQAEKAKNIEGKQVLPPGHKAGDIFVIFDSKNKPGVVDQDRQEILDPARVYSGCLGRVAFNAKAWTMGGKQGVKLYLNHYQFMGDGEPLGGRTRAEDAFAPVGGSVDAESGATAADMFG